MGFSLAVDSLVILFSKLATVRPLSHLVLFQTQREGGLFFKHTYMLTLSVNGLYYIPLKTRESMSENTNCNVQPSKLSCASCQVIALSLVILYNQTALELL